MAKLSEIDECINQEKGLRMFNGGEKKAFQAGVESRMTSCMEKSKI